ncbi:FTR1 family protein [Neobacillus drentensis]|uniref:FTR1 family iron permease n=1 Tax=Neobacillus drentensis TaxID=220684 RepID=UPI002FFF314E
MLRFKTKRKSILILMMFFVFFQAVHPAKAEVNHDELFVLIGDSLMKAKDGDQSTISTNMEQFATEWKAIKNKDSEQAKKVEQALQEVQSLLTRGKIEKDVLSKSLSSLSSMMVLYDQEQNPQDKEKGKEQVKQMIPLIATFQKAIEDENQAALKTQYQSLLNKWNASEKIVHDESIVTYGSIEKYMVLIRIAITQNPVDLDKAKTNIEKLSSEVENFLAGKVSKQVQGDYSLSDLSTLLSKAESQISHENYNRAENQLNEVLNVWPMVEGDVQTRDSKLYSDLETKIPTAISLLSSAKVDAPKAEEIVKEIHSRLVPLISKTDYSLWDAALILLREGLEGLLIVATLLAFLKKMGLGTKQKWIWAGVGAGILASAVLAIIINIVFSRIVAASSREYIEGITGVVAVIMMLTVGAWLHNKASIGNWNKYINQQMEQAIARGSLVSFAFISFLSVFREGAETIIFYTGITPYISMQQLVLGVILAVGILAIVGFAIIYYSVKIPIRFFFKAATFLIYILAFKILGISIHALQISDVLSTSTVHQLPFIHWIGLYPTLETTITQLLLVIVILGLTWMIKKRTVITNN